MKLTMVVLSRHSSKQAFTIIALPMITPFHSTAFVRSIRRYQHVSYYPLYSLTDKRLIAQITSAMSAFFPLVLSSCLSTEHHKAGAGERSILGDRDKRGWQLNKKHKQRCFNA